jgi:enoyl-CoA hydratase
VFRRLERCGKPVIAAVNGFALGGGCELAMACHLRVASETARFGQPEVKLGIGPGYGGTVRLPRLVGKGRALELLLTGEMIDAAAALEAGLVNRVVSPENLAEAVNDCARTIAGKSPFAVRLGKAAVRAQSSMGLADAYDHMSRVIVENMMADDAEEGIRAFFEKRPPNWRS